MLPDRAVEVVNAANIAWATRHVARLLDECAEHSPDAFVVLTGQAEVVDLGELRLAQSGLLRAFRSLRLVRLLERSSAGSAGFAVLGRTEGSVLPVCSAAEVAALDERFAGAREGALAAARTRGI